MEVDSGEAIVFAYPQGVELDGPLGLSQGRNPLLEKKKNKYRLRDYSERGSDEKLGLQGTPIIDVLHRILWLLEKGALPIFRERIRGFFPLEETVIYYYIE